MKKRLICLLLVACLLVPVLLQSAPFTLAAGGTVNKKETSRAIAIVFDNSGSMYVAPHPMAWSQATYALEAFAAMLNKGDKLMVYPMNDEVYAGKEGKEIPIPLVITDPAEAPVIRSFFNAKQNTATPFARVVDAYEGLAGVTADEKYLIVLTDGEFTDENSGNVQKKLEEYSQDVNVMFLGIGNSVPDIKENTEKMYVREAKESKMVVSVLADMCNRVFGRNTLPDEYITNKKQINLDVSMSKVILFVQGENIGNVKLDKGSPVSQQAVRYSEEGWKNHTSTPDKTLQGMIVTYENMDEGVYELLCDGEPESVTVYYEPDVRLQVLFQNADGVVDPSKDTLYSGKYTMKCQMVDKNGKVTESKLLKNVKYTVSYELNNQTYGPFQQTEVEVELKAEDVFSASFMVEYLDGYSITLSSQDLNWSADGKVKIDTRTVGSFSMQINGGKEDYDLSSLETDAVYNVSFTYDGAPLTGEQLDAVTFDEPWVDGGNAKVVTEKTNDGYTVSLKYNGDATSTAVGDQTLVFSSTYTNVDGQKANTGEIKRKFTIEDDGESLSVKLLIHQPYYEVSKIEQGKPIIVRVFMGGNEITPEAFDETTLEFDAEGIPFEVEPLREDARYVVKLKKADNIASGKHTITVRVTGKDAVGRQVTAEGTGTIECQTYPAWLPWLIGIAAALVIAFLIYLYLNTKVLPNQVMPGNGTFIVDGDKVNGSFQCAYSGKGAKTGTLRVTSPRCATNPRAQCGVSLEIEAVSPRYTRSSSRRVRVVGITPTNPGATLSIQIGAARFTKDPTTNKLVKAGGRPDAPIDFNFGNNAAIMVTAEIMDMTDGSSVSCSINVPMRFY